MKTYEMVALADKNGKTYRTKDVFYNSKKGFTNKRGERWPARAYVDHEDELNTFIHEDGWMLACSYPISQNTSVAFFADGMNILYSDSDGIYLSKESFAELCKLAKDFYI